MNNTEDERHAPAALVAESLSHRYGQQHALRDLNLQVEAGEMFALLGPNGSGKTTLFRLISTLAKVQSGDIRIFGHSVIRDTQSVRACLGIIFQSPSLDPKLTVLENIRCQATLYGLTGSPLAERIQEVTHQLGIENRLGTKTEELSGGLKRRVELAKGILHRPKLLLMDEPSTGLDPASRLDMWHALKDMQQKSGVTVLMTTHLLEEADKADRIAILHEGSVVAIGKPSQLRNELGEQVLSIATSEHAAVLGWLAEKAIEAQRVDQQIRVVGSHAANMVVPLTNEFGTKIQSLTLGQPSLEDVFVAKTGHRFWTEDKRETAKPKKKRR